MWHNRVDNFRRVPNPSIWMYYLPDPGTNRVVGKKADLYDSTNPDWVPSLKLGPVRANLIRITSFTCSPPPPRRCVITGVEADTEVSQANVKRYQRVQLRKESTTQHAAAESLLNLQDQPHFTSLCIPGSDRKTDNASRCSFLLKGSFERPFRCRMNLILPNMALKEKLKQTRISPESLQHDPEKVKHFTGLNYNVLMALSSFLCWVLTNLCDSVVPFD
ncbi:hypothetical protein ACJMK2_043565 [Sinanodonta woodiana]|uniref:Uncharacterized protein n=1 Tax=Sinanodonta woodiana TaxID=1069815 RepID=A0ABD3VY33_SINWO